MANQVMFTTLLLLRLKSWKLLLLLLTMIFCTMSIKLWHQTVSNMELGVEVDKLKAQALDSKKFLSKATRIVGNMVSSNLVDTTEALLRRLDASKSFKSLYTQCHNSNCLQETFSFMQRNKGTRLYYIDENNRRIVCLAHAKSLLHCAFLWTILELSQSAAMLSNGTMQWYKKFYMFEEVQHADNDSSNVQTFWLIAFQMALVTAVVCCYLLTTVFDICDLKVNGFLQSMVRKGLSPFAFWAAVWLVTIVELLLIAISSGVSFYLQLHGLYSFTSIIYMTFITYIYVLCLAAFILLLTVLTNNFYTICTIIFFYAAISGVLILSNRLVHQFYADSSLKSILSMLPLANIAEQLNFVDDINARIGVSSHYHIVGVILNAIILAVICCITLYLDFVLSTGNGICYPVPFLCRSVSASTESKPPFSGMLPLSVESMDLDVFIRLDNALYEIPSSTNKPTGSAGISVDIYEGQITAVVDYDGTASSSLLSVLIGRTPVSSGTVWLGGYTFSCRIARICRHLRVGECPLDNALSHRLTVAQSLSAALVASSQDWSQCEVEINKVLSLLHLVDKLPCRVGCLSASQQRKLSVALALLGNPQLVVLDEPARGLDPVSRRRLWRLLQSYRQGRLCCLVVGTQFVDEVDQFADRAIFISPGNTVICAGTLAFVRRTLNCGKTVRITLKDNARTKDRQMIETVLKNLQLECLSSKMKIHTQNSHFIVEVPHVERHLLYTLATHLRSIDQHVSFVEINNVPISRALEHLSSTRATNDIGKLRKAKISKSARYGRNESEVMIANQRDMEGQQNKSHKVLSQASCCGATCGIFSLHWLILKRNLCNLLTCILLPIFLLLLYVLMLWLEKKTITDMSQSSDLINLSSIAAGHFPKGICIGDAEIPALHEVSDDRCSLLYTGISKGNNKFISIRKPLNGSLYTFLRKSSSARAQLELCTKMESQVPCPFVYANTWHVPASGMYSELQIAVGSYSFLIKHQEVVSAATTYRASQRAFEYFSGGEIIGSYNLVAFRSAEFKSLRTMVWGTIFQIFLLTTLPTLYLGDILKHRATKWTKYLAAMGVSKLGYWTSTLAYHWLQYAAVYIVMLILSIAISSFIYSYGDVYLLSVVGLTLTCGLVNNLLLAYIVGSVFNSSIGLLATMYLLFSITMGVLVVTAPSTGPIAIAMLVLLPPFAVGSLTLNLINLRTYAMHFSGKIELLNIPRIEVQNYIWDYSINAIVLPLHTMVLIMLLWAVENACLVCCSPRDEDGPTKHITGKQGQLSDQETGVDRIHFSTVEFQNVNKTYPSSYHALRNLTLGVKAGEVVVLSGPNGSGVTTALAMLTGRVRASSGRCRVSSSSGKCWMSGARAAASGMVAYSPQINPLFAALTTEDHLYLYARMLGASREKVQQIMQETDLAAIKNRPVYLLREGHKRRLSVAIALLSSSPLLIVDDLSTGIAPWDQQSLWRTVARRSTSSLSVIVSSHCLAGLNDLASQLVLINRGFLVEAGSAQQLREQYEIFVMEIEFQAQTTKSVGVREAIILKAFANSFFSLQVLDQSPEWMKFSIPLRGHQSPLASYYQLLELKQQLGLTDVKLYLPSLDELVGHVVRQHDRAVQFDANPTDVSLLPTAEYYNL